MAQSTIDTEQTAWVRAALRELGIDRLVLIVFDSALPREEPWDIGTGTPYSALAREFFSFASSLGFNGIQFGPQGAVGRDFPSPYDGTIFSRNPLSIALDRLPKMDLFEASHRSLEGGLLPEEAWSKALSARPQGAEHRAAHAFAFDTGRRLLYTVAERLRASAPSLGAAAHHFEQWRAQNCDWLLSDALYDALCEHHGVSDFGAFPEDIRGLWDTDLARASPGQGATSLLGRELPEPSARKLASLFAEHTARIDNYAWIQFIVHEQHCELHEWASKSGLELYGDFQVGYSRRDLWHYGATLFREYWLGAPPSRTNPLGQPWGQPVLAPDLYVDPDGAPGPALRLLLRRASKNFSEYDRLRVDHPHGLVCPWVYRRDTGDDLLAVQNGARLFSSPNLADHPALQRHSLVEESRLNATASRYDDHRIQSLTNEQVHRFSRAFDVLVQEAQRRGGVDRLVCEVLSTQPLELGEVLRQYSLGRFRVTQKADVENPGDVYSSENAQPEDWMMLGNHDTPTIWQLLDRWSQSGQVERQVEYLSRRLGRDEQRRLELRERFATEPSALAHAKFADLLVGKARNVMLSFGDLFGFLSQFNAPGTVSGDNWSERIPRDFVEAYQRSRAAGGALDLVQALRLALQRVAPGSPLLARQ